MKELPFINSNVRLYLKVTSRSEKPVIFAKVLIVLKIPARETERTLYLIPELV
jgi:hypothetical protein